MGNCLVTKLNGVVDNDNLDILGMVTIVNDKVSVQQVEINNTDVDVNLKVINGYFTDSEGSANYGTTAVNRAGDWSANVRYITPGATLYADKYVNQGVFKIGQCRVDINSLAYSKFNIFSGMFKGDASLFNIAGVTFLQFINDLNDLTKQNYSDVYGDLTPVLAASAATITELCPRTKGNLNFNIENINFSAGLNIYGIPITVQSHDLSKLNGVYMFDRDASRVLFDTWSGTLVSPYIVGLYNVRFATSEEIDRMFIENASKPVHPSCTVNQKHIRIYGGANNDVTRTSASDAAVATLKSLGFTISVNGVIE